MIWFVELLNTLKSQKDDVSDNIVIRKQMALSNIFNNVVITVMIVCMRGLAVDDESEVENTIVVIISQPQLCLMGWVSCCCEILKKTRSEYPC